MYKMKLDTLEAVHPKYKKIGHNIPQTTENMFPTILAFSN